MKLVVLYQKIEETETMQSVPKSERKRVTFLGRTNVGKSSLINALLNQKVSIVSELPGTTTDPTEKAIEILPAGPLLFTDTAGVDDISPLSNERIKRTKEIVEKTDLAVFVFSYPFTNFEETYSKIEKPYLDRVKELEIPYIFVVNKCDISDELPDLLVKEANDRLKIVSSKNMTNIEELKAYIGFLLASDTQPKILEGIVSREDIFVLVTPVHPAYPKGRLKPLQVQVIREILNCNAIAIETKPETLHSILKSITKKPKLIITDATTLNDVSKIVPQDIPLTTFSMLFARYKGDLSIFKRGAEKLKSIVNGSKIAIIESCTHHRQEGDMAKELLPQFIKQITNKEFEYIYISGTNFDFEKLSGVSYALHCGGCMLTKTEMINRLKFLNQKNIEVLNYGMLMAIKDGLLERTLKPLVEMG